MRERKWSSVFAAMICTVVCSLGLASQSAGAFPDRPITIVVAYPVGGAADRAARVIIDSLSRNMGQTIVVENVGGANGALAARRVARSAPDGHVLLFCETAVFTINPVLMASPGYAYEDFQPISLAVRAGLLFIVNSNVPASNLAEIRSYAEANPNTATFGIVGVGSALHMALLRLQAEAKLKLQAIPYQGAPQLMTDLLANRIQTTVLAASGLVLPHIKTGAVRAFGYSAMNRSPLAPDVQTFDEQGLKNFAAGIQYGFFAPKNTPADIVNQLQKEIAKALNDPETRKKLNGDDFQTVGNSPEQLDADLRQLMPQMKELVASSGMTVK